MRAGGTLLAVGKNIAFEKLQCRLPTYGAVADFQYGSKFSHDEISALRTEWERGCKILAVPELAARIRDLHFSLVIGASSGFQALRVHPDAFSTVLSYLPNVENVKSLR